MTRVIFYSPDSILRNLIPAPDSVYLYILNNLDHEFSLLSELCSRTKSKVVLTSDWRDNLELRKKLKRFDIPMIGATPHGKNKGREIMQWMIDKKFRGEYIIIDDESSELDRLQRTRLIYTREEDRLGLQYKHLIFAEALFREITPNTNANAQFLDAILCAIEEDWLRVMWNIHQKDYGDQNPWRNTGNIQGYKNGTFEVHAYDWNWDYDSSKSQPPNFRWRDLDITWYKYCGRGLSTNRPVTHDELALMLEECLESLRRWEKKNEQD